MPRTTTRSRSTQEQTSRGFTPVDASVTFSAGLMMVGSVPQRPTKVEQWESSNGLTVYSAVEWTDPNTGQKRSSCNCPGWAIKKPGRPRQCIHTKDLEGTATCTRRKVDSTQIRTVADAVAKVPELVDGRELRGIML